LHEKQNSLGSTTGVFLSLSKRCKILALRTTCSNILLLGETLNSTDLPSGVKYTMNPPRVSKTNIDALVYKRSFGCGNSGKFETGRKLMTISLSIIKSTVAYIESSSTLYSRVIPFRNFLSEPWINFDNAFENSSSKASILSK